MQVYIPYSFRHEPTWESLAALDPVGVPMNDEGAYLGHFMERWAAREPFVNVEHDVVATVAQVEDLIGCPEPWCAYPYEEVDPHSGGLWFGCVKFAPAIMDALPDVWQRLYDWWVAERPDPVWRLVGEVLVKGPPPAEVRINEWLPIWRSLDTWFIHAAQRDQLACHRHLPPVRNCRPADHPKLASGL